MLTAAGRPLERLAVRRGRDAIPRPVVWNRFDLLSPIGETPAVDLHFSKEDERFRGEARVNG